jgi:hypothetical protein
MILVVLREGEFFIIFLGERGWNEVVKACVIVAYSFAIAWCNDPFYPYHRFL